MREEVILVDENDNVLGSMEKMEAHEKGALHRAFSVFIFNGKNEMLLQQRALAKYHSAGLWTNACCSHPRPGEDTALAAVRRLREEMGLEAPLIHKGSFVYITAFDNGLTEHELDHVFTGNTNHQPLINKEEVEDYKWMAVEDIKALIKTSPGGFTSWFKLALEKWF